MNDLQESIFCSKYGRWNLKFDRRETLEEIIDRVTLFLVELKEKRS